VLLGIAVGLKISSATLLVEHRPTTPIKAKKYTRLGIWTGWTNTLRRSWKEIATWKVTRSRNWFKRRFRSY